MLKWSLFLTGAWALSTLASTPMPAPETPGGSWTVPARAPANDGPVIYEYSKDAGPDQTVFLVGDKLGTNVSLWGGNAENANGKEWQGKVQLKTNGYMAATLPERAPDGPFLMWLKNEAGWSAPLVVNTPELWWCSPVVARPGGEVRIFGRNLSRRPDFSRAFVYINQKGQAGQWTEVVSPGKYSVRIKLPEQMADGEYEIWVHAGAGGEHGWGGPLRLQVVSEKTLAAGNAVTQMRSGASGREIQKAMEELSSRGGGTVKLAAGAFAFSGTLQVPSHVKLEGAGRDKTTLQLTYDATTRFARLSGLGWNQAPGAIHSVGDYMEYEINVPEAGEWIVWMRYATDMKGYNQPGVSGNHVLIVDDGIPVPLMKLDNTGGWGNFKWSDAAKVGLTPGKHKLTWKNVKGGGITIDAFLLARDPAYTPSQNPPPVSGKGVIVFQAEDCIRFVSKEGQLPGGERAAVWVSGEGAGLKNLTVLGNAQVNFGVAVRATGANQWVKGCVVENVRVADCDGKQGENCGVHVRYAEDLSVSKCELWGRAPLFISGAKQSVFASNRLVSVTRFGGNAEAAILGRNETIERCMVEGNVIASPTGAEAGGPTARRLLWFSTGHGSITHNYIAGNGVEKANGPGAEAGAGQARFGGVAGTDQNVGEMILFEANHRTAFFGALAGADMQSVTLPKTVPRTPDEWLGGVDRAKLGHDTAGNETPYWPPDVDDGSEEPPIYEYYVTVFEGRGQGQTRRVVKREGEKLILERPWSVPPAAGAVVAVGTAFYQNQIVGNYTPDGMTGIQLWISCVENVVAGNTIARQRKPGLYLYANGTTLASSMPRTWNRGISPLFWNICEGNRAEETSAGALVTSGDERDLPINFPRALGNVLRHNSFIRNRTQGVLLTSRPTPQGLVDRAASITGTIVEFNVVRDAQAAFQAGNSCDAVVFRRNHAYFWYPVSVSTNAPVAFQINNGQTSVALEHNSVEGIHGVNDHSIQGIKTPSGVRNVPE